MFNKMIFRGFCKYSMIYIAYQLIYFIWILLRYSSNHSLSVLINCFDTHLDYSMFDYYTTIVHNKVQALFNYEDIQYLQYNTSVFMMKPPDAVI